MRALRLSLVFFLAACTAKAQEGDSVKKKWVGYYFQFQSGALVGCQSCGNGKLITFTSSMTQGVKIGSRLRAGAGVELNSYFNWNVLPGKASVSYDLLGKRNAFYLQLDYGGGLACWAQYLDEYGYKRSRAGEMYGYSVGYRIKNGNAHYAFGVGRKVQHIISYYEYPTYYWRMNEYVQGEPSRRTLDHSLRRLMIFMAIGWK